MALRVSIFACDPGITTGFSIGVITDDCFYITSQEAKLSHGQLWQRLDKLHPNFMVCESFEFRGRARDNVELFSRELIGVMRLRSEEYGNKLTLQTAAEGKGNFTDAKLRQMRLYNKSTKHGRDAVRHILQWFTFKEGFQFNTDQQVVLVTEDYLRDEGMIP